MSLPAFIPIKSGTGLPLQGAAAAVSVPFANKTTVLAPEDVIPRPSVSMYVGKIPENFDDAFVRKLLEQCGPVRNLQRVKDVKTGVPKRFGFCEYETPDSVEVALSAFKGVLFKNSADGKEEELVIKCDDKTMQTVHEYIENVKQAAQKRKIANEYKRIETLPPGVPEKTAPVDEAKLAKISDEEFKKDFERRIRVAKQCIGMISKEKSGVTDAVPSDDLNANENEDKTETEKEDEQLTEEIKAWRERTAKKDAETMKKMLSYEEDIKRDAEHDERRERNKKLDRLKRDLKSFEHDINILGDSDFKEYEKHYEARELDRIKKWKRYEDDYREYRKKRHDKILSEKERKREREDDNEDRERDEREKKRRKEEEDAIERRKTAEEERRRKEIEEEKRLITVNMNLNLNSTQKNSEKNAVAASTTVVNGVIENVDGDDDDDDDSFGLKHQEKMREEINKKIMDMVPTDKNELFEFRVDWSVVSRYNVIDEKIWPWVVKKVTEFLGEEEPTLVSFIVGEFKSRPTPEKLVKKLEGALGEDTVDFVVQAWKLLVFETLSATYNKKINYIN